MADEQQRSGVLGEGLRAQGAHGYDEAERLIREALQEGEPDAGYYLGELLIELDRAVEAVPVLREAVEAGDMDALIPLGNALWDQGDVAGAEANHPPAARPGEVAAGAKPRPVFFDLGRVGG